MRIIAGRAKGRPLLVPRGKGTRPTPDRVREALFSILGDVEGARVLDLFAGTGALGLEALSRGAAHATFVECQREALAALRRNALAVLAEEAHARSRVVPRNAQAALVALAREGLYFDLVFMDPPYAAGLIPPTLAALGALNMVRHPVAVVCEHPGKEAAPSAPGWRVAQTRRFGDVALSWYEQTPS